MSIDLRLGRWESVLADVECDALICDPPYSARTHEGYRSAADFAPIAAAEAVARVRKDKGSTTRTRGALSRSVRPPITKGRFELPYAPITEEWALAFVEFWAPRVREWLVVFGDHVSSAWFSTAMHSCGLVGFAPVPWVRTNSAPRFNADGPANSCEWIAVARHRGLPRERRSLPGWYEGTIGNQHSEERIVTGGKPLWLMRALVRDYSRPGDLICDPCAGGATTLLAAAMEGRRAVGAEMDPVTYAKAQKRIDRGYTPPLFTEDRPEPEQTDWTKGTAE